MANWWDKNLTDKQKFRLQEPQDPSLLNVVSTVPTPVGDVASGLLAAQDVSKGNYGTAALNALGLLPFVPSMAGTFIGKGSKMWDALKAEEAIKMADKGIDERKIWADTGTFKGADGKWRQEISDDTSLTTFPKRNEMGTILSINKRLKHDDLYKSYPELKKIDIELIPDGLGKAGGFNGNWLELATSEAGNIPSAKSIMLHELQHAIQSKEGFARGGMPSEISSYLQKENPSKYMELLKSGKLTDPSYLNDAYKKLAGEAEARATETRMYMTPAERLAKFPFDSYDVPRESLYVRGLLE
jgi:hypothetical protein